MKVWGWLFIPNLFASRSFWDTRRIVPFLSFEKVNYQRVRWRDEKKKRERKILSGRYRLISPIYEQDIDEKEAQRTQGMKRKDSGRKKKDVTDRVVQSSTENVCIFGAPCGLFGQKNGRKMNLEPLSFFHFWRFFVSSFPSSLSASSLPWEKRRPKHHFRRGMTMWRDRTLTFTLRTSHYRLEKRPSFRHWRELKMGPVFLAGLSLSSFPSFFQLPFLSLPFFSPFGDVPSVLSP